MEHAVVNLVHAALWIMFVIFALAAVGLIAIVKWIVDAFRRTERAVESGVSSVEDRFRQ